MKNIILAILISSILSCTNNSAIKTENIKSQQEEVSSSWPALKRNVYLQIVNEQLKNDSIRLSTSFKKDTIDCGTTLTIEQYDQILSQFESVCSPELAPDDTVKNINYPIYIFILSDSKNNLAIKKEEINSAISELEDKYMQQKYLLK